MTSSSPTTPDWVQRRLDSGLVIPAHPLALTSTGRLDERRQRALTRYYHAAGAGGLAVGVHTTQFAIREPRHGLFRPVLELASETVSACDAATGRQTVRIAGICGETAQAMSEAVIARELGYHAGLVSPGALREWSEDRVLEHCRHVGRELPLFGFYLQTAVGGRRLSRDFWTRFAALPCVLGIKIAPFNRYQTLDVLRGVADSGRAGNVALYTGNDDHILLDLLSTWRVPGSARELRIVGGLLGHWACWTRTAVDHWERCQRAVREGTVPSALLSLAVEVTDANAAIFDAANGFAGCIAGIHEVLRRQGLMEGIRCLDPAESLSPGQSEELDRIQNDYPHLNDDAFVAEHLDRWMQ